VGAPVSIHNLREKLLAARVQSPPAGTVLPRMWLLVSRVCGDCLDRRTFGSIPKKQVRAFFSAPGSSQADAWPLLDKLR
jgi:hypothetical protein